MAENFIVCPNCADTIECRNSGSCFDEQMRRSPVLPPQERDNPPRLGAFHNMEMIPGYVAQCSAIGAHEFAPSIKPRIDACPGLLKAADAVDADRVARERGYAGSGTFTLPNGAEMKGSLEVMGSGAEYTAKGLECDRIARLDLAECIVEEIQEKTKTDQGTPLFHLKSSTAVLMRDIIVKHLEKRP